MHRPKALIVFLLAHLSRGEVNLGSPPRPIFLTLLKGGGVKHVLRRLMVPFLLSHIDVLKRVDVAFRIYLMKRATRNPHLWWKYIWKKLIHWKVKVLCKFTICFANKNNPKSERVFFNIGSEDETSVGRLVVTEVTVPQYGVEGKHAVLYCRWGFPLPRW